MHALIIHALEAARAEGVAHFSLAATPPRRAPKNPMLHHLHKIVLQRAGNHGLIQFKSGFAPYWAPRYAASQSRIALLLGLFDIALEVQDNKEKRPARDDTGAKPVSLPRKRAAQANL